VSTARFETVAEKSEKGIKGQRGIWQGGQTTACDFEAKRSKD
jgi:hypothetical protein